MNTWNSELIESLYDRQALGYITTLNGQVRLHDHAFAVEYRQIVEAENFNPSKANTAATITEARARRAINKPRWDEYVDPVLGCVLQWLSEVGKTAELDGLLAYADASLGKTWENGGLFYPRRDCPNGDNDEWTHMDPFTGNAAIGYARLNVKNGQKLIFERPWTRDALAARPWIDGVELSQGIDTIRAIWDEGPAALVLTMRTWDRSQVTAEPVARNLDAGFWAVYVDGRLVKRESVGEKGESVAATVTVGGDDVDVVFQRIEA